jgi:hypothetical protein
MKTTTWGHNRDMNRHTAWKQIALSVVVVAVLVGVVWRLGF